MRRGQDRHLILSRLLAGACALGGLLAWPSGEPAGPAWADRPLTDDTYERLGLRFEVWPDGADERLVWVMARNASPNALAVSYRVVHERGEVIERSDLWPVWLPQEFPIFDWFYVAEDTPVESVQIVVERVSEGARPNPDSTEPWRDLLSEPGADRGLRASGPAP